MTVAQWTVFWKNGRLTAVDESKEEYPMKTRSQIVGYANAKHRDDAIRYFEQLEKLK